MVLPLAVILTCQLAGEALVRWLGLPLPGPVAGMILLLASLLAVPPLHGRIAAVSHQLLKHMALFFVPAGVGLMTLTRELRDHGWLLAVVLVVSTWLTAGASEAAFALARRRPR